MKKYLGVLMSLFLLVGCKKAPDPEDSIPKTSLGEITINGNPVDRDLLLGWAESKIHRSNICPPISDLFVRDQVVKRLLIIEEAKNQNMQLSDGKKMRLRKNQARLERKKSSEKRIRDTKLELLTDTTEAYEDLLMPYLTDDELMAVHKQLVAEAHPDFVNVLVVRKFELVIARGTQVGDEVYQALVDERSIEELVKEYEFEVTEDDPVDGATLVHSPDEWQRPDQYLRRPNGDIFVGDSRGPREIGRWGFYEKIIETRVYPVVETGNQYPGINFKIKSWLRFIDNNNRRIELVGRLFDEADIREDGVPVDNHVLPRALYGSSRPSCPRGSANAESTD